MKEKIIKEKNVKTKDIEEDINKKNSKNIMIAFILNIVFAVIELIGGILTNSVSIISDSIHDFSDAISIGIAFFLEKKSLKKPDDKYTYGYLRYSVLGALITSTFLLMGSVVILYNAIPRIINPQTVDYNGMLILGIIGVLINGAGTLITSKGNKLNEKVVSLHLLEDVLGWLAVIIVSVVMKMFDLPILDPLLSIGITIFILYNVFKNLKSIFEIFLEKAPSNIDFEKLKEELLKNNENILNIHHIHLWTIDGEKIYATMHVVVPNNIDKNVIIELKKYINNEAFIYKITHITLEIEYESEICDNLKCENKQKEITMHKHTHSNVH